MRYNLVQNECRTFGVGLGAIYVGQRVGDVLQPPTFSGPVFMLPSYTRWDAGLYYKQGRLDASVYFENIFNETYYTSSISQYEVFPGCAVQLPRPGRLSILMSGTGHRLLRPQQLRRLVVDGIQARGELQFVHRLLGVDHAGGDVIHLAADELRLLPVHGHLAQRADLVLQAVDLHADQLVVLAGLVQVRQPRAARLQVVVQRRAEPLPGRSRRSSAGSCLICCSSLAMPCWIWSALVFLRNCERAYCV